MCPRHRPTRVRPTACTDPLLRVNTQSYVVIVCIAIRPLSARPPMRNDSGASDCLASVSAVSHGGDPPASGHRLPAPHSVGPSRFGSESVRRDLRDGSEFSNQQRPGIAASNGHPPAARAQPQPDGMGRAEVRLYPCVGLRSAHAPTVELASQRHALVAGRQCRDRRLLGPATHERLRAAAERPAALPVRPVRRWIFPVITCPGGSAVKAPAGLGASASLAVMPCTLSDGAIACQPRVWRRTFEDYPQHARRMNLTTSSRGQQLIQAAAVMLSLA